LWGVSRSSASTWPRSSWTRRWSSTRVGLEDHSS
jgi:hypothetical protein